MHHNHLRSIRGQHDIKIWFNLNQQQKMLLIMVLHFTYARFLPERTLIVVRTVFFGAQGSHGVPPLKWKGHLLLNHDSELKKKK